jgi:outer membrane protein
MLPRQFLVLKKTSPIFLAFFLIALFAGTAFGGEGRTGFIDFQRALSETKEWQEKSGVFNKEFEKEQIIISERAAKIGKMLEDINKQSMVLDPTLKKAKEEAFRAERRDFERYVKDKSEEFSAREKGMTEELIKKMVKVLKKVGKEKDFTMILEKKSTLYLDEDKDITSAVVKIYDKMYATEK